MTRAEERGIQVENHPYDRGYWARYDGLPRDSVTWREGKKGWDDCHRELRSEALSPQEPTP